MIIGTQLIVYESERFIEAKYLGDTEFSLNHFRAWEGKDLLKAVSFNILSKHQTTNRGIEVINK